MTKFTSDITTIALDPCNFEPAVWTDCATKLRLKYLANHPELPKELKEAGLPADQAVLHILRLECFYRETHKIEMNMGMAKFPSQASIESFDFSCSELDKSEILSLAKCDWIASHENVLFYGQPGLGKTHLAIALGKKAIVDKGYSVKFISANDLMAELEQARQQKAVDDYLRLINRADLIIVDEFGYPLMENHPSYAALFYAFISSRYEKKSTIITTNRSVTDWPRYLGNDKDCCGAILDRFLHYSIRVCFKGQSYRQRHMRQERLSANPDKATFAKKMTTE